MLHHANISREHCVLAIQVQSMEVVSSKHMSGHVQIRFTKYESKHNSIERAIYSACCHNRYSNLLSNLPLLDAKTSTVTSNETNKPIVIILLCYTIVRLETFFLCYGIENIA